MNNVIKEANELFKTAGFDYNICGGFAFDIHAQKELRTHGDLDIAVFEENKIEAVKFLFDNGWSIFGRFMEDNKMATQMLFYKVDNPDDEQWITCKNFWAIKPTAYLEMYELTRHAGTYSYKLSENTQNTYVQNFDFIEIEVDSRKNDEYIVRNEKFISRKMEKAILYKEGIPYLAPEIILFLKADRKSMQSPSTRGKTKADFEAIVPILADEQKSWLKDSLSTAYPDGYAWLEGLV